VHRFRPLLLHTILYSVLVVTAPFPAIHTHISAYSAAALPHVLPAPVRLDSRLPVQTMRSDSGFTNINATFGSRFDFNISPGSNLVHSGTDGVFHDNTASYIVGVAPADQHRTFIFHMGKLNRAQGDTYLSNERWIQGVDTTRWSGDAAGSGGMQITVDFIDTFSGEPGCTAIADCAESVKDDTVPALLVGVSLQNTGRQTQTGTFVFGSNRDLPASNACIQHTTPAGTPVNILSYAPGADVTGGTLFLAGQRANWDCNTALPDRAGLAWHYSVGTDQTQTAYLILGGWNAHQRLLVNTMLPAGCQNEGLYAATEWSSENAVVDFAIDNLSTGDNLLARAQSMEDYLINNTVLTPEQRWIIGDTLRSYKATSWLTARQDCAGGGYDAAVYEGSYGFLTTVDVMHEYGYFEITRVPWFFKAAMSMVFKNATSDAFGTYFQHDQGGDIDSQGNCTQPGKGTPTFRATCYAPPYVLTGVPMPTEENDNVALLMAYYEFITGDTPFLAQHIQQIDAAMQHNIRVGDPTTGIAYQGQDTNTTYDAANDCLHNNASNSGNLYYQGLKEATGYRATAYLDSLVPQDADATTWKAAAAKIEDAMVREYDSHGFLPIADSSAFSNCNGRSIALGEGLFYLHLIGLDRTMNQELLTDLAKQYPADLTASTLTQASMISMTSFAASGSQCAGGYCRPYSWFSKVMLSGIVADLIYTKYGCTSCSRLSLVQAAYERNSSRSGSFIDGIRSDGTDWDGHIYPRGIISWAYLDSRY
jgi:hypothetical protein